MSILSKYARESKSNVEIDHNTNLHKLKVCELKHTAKANGLYVSGTKDILIARISSFFLKVRKTVTMQAIYRGYNTRRIFKMRGAGLIHRNKCVNDSDFFTLDTIHDVNVCDFFSYTDMAGFIYGFDLNSLKLMFKNQGTISNPYTRERIEGGLLETIIKLFKHQSLGENTETESTGVTIFERMRIIRNRPYQSRIRELFCEIDSLGNYTESGWYSNLNRYELVGFLRNMYEIWHYRAEMSTNTKNRICPHFNPFQNGILYFNDDIREMNMDELSADCLTIMENLIYTGIDNEYRKLGVLHVLSALTLVSIPAKNAMPWLYESLVF